MPEDKYDDDQDMMDMDFSSLGQDRKAGLPRSARNQTDPGTGKKILVSTGASLLIILIIIAILLFTGNRSSEKPIAAIEAHVKTLEEKMARFGDMDAKLSSARQQQETLQQAVLGLENSLKSLQERLGHLSREVASLKKRMGITPALTKSTALIRNKLISETRPRSHVVLKGESLYKIAKKYGISLQELYRLNNLTSKSVIHPGLRLMITPDSKK